MIYIDLDSFSPNETWRWEARWHTTTMSNLIAIIDKKNYIINIWSNIKGELLHIRNANKCWFSEARETVSDYHIEHFRPKKEVTKLEKLVPKVIFQEEQRSQWTSIIKIADGYWWLAFDYRNYRISGSKVNSSFKKNFFPIRFGSNFISENPSQDYQFEEVVLLDPTKPDDPELLTFIASGEAIPTYPHDIDVWKYTRAAVSIIVYGLNDIEDLIPERLKKWSKCRTFIDETQRKYQLREVVITNGIDYTKDNEILMFEELEQSLVDNYEKLKNEIHPSSAFSSVAMACVKSYDYEWIKDYVLS